MGDQYLDPLREAIDIGRYGEIPSHITHLSQQKRHPGGADEILELVERSRDDGVDVTFDMFPSLIWQHASDNPVSPVDHGRRTGDAEAGARIC